MERLSGTRYAYDKNRVAWLVPLVFLVPGGALMIVIFLLSSRALINGEIFAEIPTGAKVVTGMLILLGCFVASDLWHTFRRVLNEAIWITEREIIWSGSS